MTNWTPKEIAVLKRLNQPVSVRNLALNGKTSLLRRKREYASALGITVEQLVAEAATVDGRQARAHQVHVKRMYKNFSAAATI